MNNNQAITALAENIFADEYNRDKDELLALLISSITASFELSEVLDLMAEKTSLEDVYEATADFVMVTKTKIDNEDISCASVAVRIREDSQLDIMRDVFEGRR